jgi:hypothetical protein
MIGCAVCKILVHQSCAEQFDDHIEAGGLDMESYVCATCFGREDISDQTKDRNAFKIRYLLRESRARDEALRAESSARRYKDQMALLQRRIDALESQSSRNDPPRQPVTTNRNRHQSNDGAQNLHAGDASLFGTVHEEPLAMLTKVLSRTYIQNLPAFYGNTKEWVSFQSTFNSTTLQGSFTRKLRR